MLEINVDIGQLPGGRCYQKGGARLENAIFNCLPDDIKRMTHTNLRPKKDNGDVIVEFDMIYNKGNELISFEVKGLNNKTSRCPDRQMKLYNQAIRQKSFLIENFKNNNLKISVVFCFVTGKNDSNIDEQFINKLKNEGIIVSIGESPNETIKDAIKKLKENGFFLKPPTENIKCKYFNPKESKPESKPENELFIVGSPDKVDDIDLIMKSRINKSYADILKNV
jgi:hypothetical protein